MSEKTKERLYLAVCIACFITCAVLLLSIYFEKREQAQHMAVHQPRMSVESVLQQEKAQPEMLITQEYAASMLEKMLPEGIPLEQLTVAIHEGGKIDLGAYTSREDLRDYLKAQGVELGMKQKFLMAMMPSRISLGVGFLCKTEGQNITLTPQNISAGDMDISLSFLPESFSETFSATLSEMLGLTGFPIGEIRFQEGALALIP